MNKKKTHLCVNLVQIAIINNKPKKKKNQTIIRTKDRKCWCCGKKELYKVKDPCEDVITVENSLKISQNANNRITILLSYVCPGFIPEGY